MRKAPGFVWFRYMELGPDGSEISLAARRGTQEVVIRVSRKRSHESWRGVLRISPFRAISFLRTPLAVLCGLPS